MSWRCSANTGKRASMRRCQLEHGDATAMSFIEHLQLAWERNNSLLCVGLDPEPARFPVALRNSPDGIFEFCRAIVDATANLVCCFKPQIAHFAAHRAESALERLIAHIHAQHPAVPVILDAKRGDIGTTAQQYAIEVFDRYGADAATLNPYLGRDAVQPFLDRADKGAVILCHTSNPGARRFPGFECAQRWRWIRRSGPSALSARRGNRRARLECTRQLRAGSRCNLSAANLRMCAGSSAMPCRCSFPASVHKVAMSPPSCKMGKIPPVPD